MEKLTILSRSSERFKDRAEAGRLLARQLSRLRGSDVVTLGIPRGGVVVAREMARALPAELDVVLARKLRAPGHEELAMGSVAEDGTHFLNQDVVSELRVSAADVDEEKALQLREIARRSEMIRRVRPKVPLGGKTVIVTDDGIATGATFQAALWAVRLEHPARLIAALPVGPEETVARLARDVDEMLCLRAPPYFAAVGQFYANFYPVSDEEVLQILRQEMKSQVGST